MAELIAEAVFHDGKFSQAFPNYGVERRGAPVTAFVRIDDKYIRLRSQIYHPDFAIIQESGLVEGANAFNGLKDGATVLINTANPDEVKPPQGVALKAIDATAIAMEVIGRPIINTIMLGAFAGMTGLMTMESVEKVIRERFAGDIADKNVEAAKRGFEAAKS